MDHGKYPSLTTLNHMGALPATPGPASHALDPAEPAAEVVAQAEEVAVEAVAAEETLRLAASSREPHTKRQTLLRALSESLDTKMAAEHSTHLI